MPVSYLPMDLDCGVSRCESEPAALLSRIRDTRGPEAARIVAGTMLRDSFFTPVHDEIRSWVQIEDAKCLNRNANALAWGVTVALVAFVVVFGLVEYFHGR